MAHAEQFSVVPRRPPLHFAKVRQRHPLCGRSMHIASQFPLSALWSTDQSGSFAILQLVPDAVLAVPARLSLPDWVATVHAGDMAHDREAIATAIGLGAPFQVEFALRCLDGVTRQVRLSGLPAAPGCYHGFITDLSAHHEALASARREAGEYRLLIENTTDLIAHADTAGNYLSISPSYESMMGWNPASVVGQPVIAFLHPDDRQHSAAALSSVLGGGVLPNVVEVRKRHRDGQPPVRRPPGLGGGGRAKQAREHDGQRVLDDVAEHGGRHEGVEHASKDASGGHRQVEGGELRRRRPALGELAVADHRRREERGDVERDEQPQGPGGAHRDGHDQEQRTEGEGPRHRAVGDQGT